MHSAMRGGTTSLLQVVLALELLIGQALELLELILLECRPQLRVAQDQRLQCKLKIKIV